jgi:signal peptidase I
MNRKNWKKDIVSTLIYAVIILMLAVGMRHFVVQRTMVDGHSMEDTLQDRDQLLIDKLSYRFSTPERFDIVVFPAPSEEETYYIKRVIGLPGERILITENTIYINGEPLLEEYGKEAMEEDTEGIAKTELVLGEDEYFVLGDNRNHSKDSRDASVGPIKGDTILGKAAIRIWPLESFGGLK